MDYCGVIPKDLAVGALWPQIGALDDIEDILAYNVTANWPV